MNLGNCFKASGFCQWFRLVFRELGPTDRTSVPVIERKRVTRSRKELGSNAPASFHTTDQKVRGSNPFGRTY
jgi:hypothetical protein